MPAFTVGPTQTVTGSAQNDTYIVDPNDLTLATIIDSGGAADVLRVYDRPGRTAGEFLVEGNFLVWRNYQGDTVRIQLNPDGSSPIEFFEWERLPEDGSPYLIRHQILLPGDPFLTPGTTVAGTAGADTIAAPALGAWSNLRSEIYGNAGDDTLTGSRDYRVLLYGGGGNDSMTGVGNVYDDITGDAGNDTLAGFGEGDWLDGGDDDDLIFGGAGNDFMIGGNGRDALSGGAGDDIMSGDGGLDRAIFTGTADIRVNLSLTSAQITGQGTDTLTGIEHVTSGSGNDSLTGNALANSMISGSGNDTLTGLAGDDQLTGGAGNDVLRAGSGADRLIGGLGRDQLVGGTDAAGDVFDFNTVADSAVGALRDVVQNFTRGADRIDLFTIDADTGINGNSAFAFSGTTAAAHAVWFVVSGANLILRGDVNGNATADFEILIQGQTALGAGDFIL